MKIKHLSFIILLCVIPNSIWAQTSESAMKFEGYFSDWRIAYKGKTYFGFSKKPESIAKECNCDEAALLFKESRKQYINGLITMTITLPIGLIVGTAGAVYSLSVLESAPLAVVSSAGGVSVGSSGFFVVRKSNLKGRSAVYDFNKCIETRTAK
jgi:hypothetical protein